MPLWLSHQVELCGHLEMSTVSASARATPPNLCTALHYVACHAELHEVVLFAVLIDAMPKHVSFANNISNYVLHKTNKV